MQKRAEAPRLRQDGSEIGEGTASVMWRTMKILHTFTREELYAHVAITHPTGRAAVTRYVRFLSRAGYLRGAGGQRLALASNTGPLPPHVGEDGTVYDPNKQAAASAQAYIARVKEVQAEREKETARAERLNAELADARRKIDVQTASVEKEIPDVLQKDGGTFSGLGADSLRLYKRALGY